MDRISLSIVVVGFVIMIGCTGLVAYQVLRVAQIEQHIIELIVQTHRN